MLKYEREVCVSHLHQQGAYIALLLHFALNF